MNATTVLIAPVWGWAVTATPSVPASVIVTACDVMPPDVAVTDAVPAALGALKVVDACPFLVRDWGGCSVPCVAWNDTCVPSSTGPPPFARTSAVIVVEPLAEIVEGAAESVMVASAGATIELFEQPVTRMTRARSEA